MRMVRVALAVSLIMNEECYSVVMKKVLLLTDYSSDYSRSATRYRDIFKGTRALDLLSDAFVLSGIIWRRWSCPVGKKMESGCHYCSVERCRC